MEKTIREQAELLGFEITNWDIEQIKDKYFHVLVAYGDRTKSVRSVIKKYFAAHAPACRRASHGDLPKAND